MRVIIWSIFFALVSILNIESKSFDKQNYLYAVIQTPYVANIVTWSSDGNYLAVGGNGYIWIYSMNGILIATLATNEQIVIAMKYSLDNKMLISSSVSSNPSVSNRTIIWDTTTFQEHTVINQITATDFIWFPDNKNILIGTSEGNLSVFNIEEASILTTSRILRRADQFNAINIFSFCADLDYNKIFALTNYGIYQINPESLDSEEIIYYAGGEGINGDCNPSLSLATYSRGVFINLFNGEIFTSGSSVEYPFGPDFTAKWNPVYNNAVSYVEQGLYLWDIMKLNVIALDTIERPSGFVRTQSIAWHPNGEYLAQGGKDGAYVNIWHITMEDLLNSQP